MNAIALYVLLLALRLMVLMLTAVPVGFSFLVCYDVYALFSHSGFSHHLRNCLLKKGKVRLAPILLLFWPVQEAAFL